MKTSAIGWTDFSGGAANFVLRGATPGDCEASAGCQNCYMLKLHERFGCLPECTTYYPDKIERLGRTRWPEWSPKRGEGYRPMVFVCDGGDLFHERVPFGFIYKAFQMMEARRNVTWQVLTKRPGRARMFALWYYKVRAPLPNVWMGVTAENQATAHERIPLLLRTPAAVRFVSVEPMLEAIFLRPEWVGGYPESDHWAGHGAHHPRIDWVICGAESGPHRRPFHVGWAFGLREQCGESGIPFFGKQDSGARPGKPLVLPWYGEVKEWPDGA